MTPRLVSDHVSRVVLYTKPGNNRPIFKEDEVRAIVGNIIEPLSAGWRYSIEAEIGRACWFDSTNKPEIRTDDGGVGDAGASTAEYYVNLARHIS